MEGIARKGEIPKSLGDHFLVSTKLVNRFVEIYTKTLDTRISILETRARRAISKSLDVSDSINLLGLKEKIESGVNQAILHLTGTHGNCTASFHHPNAEKSQLHNINRGGKGNLTIESADQPKLLKNRNGKVRKGVNNSLYIPLSDGYIMMLSGINEDILDAIGRIFREIQPSIENLQLLLPLLRIDPLTGVYNRSCFDLFEENIAKQDVENSENRPVFAVLSFDLNNLKKINDQTENHAEGDKLLVAFASALKHVLKRKNEVIIRMGGDEFFVIITSNTSDIEDFEVLIEYIVDKINDRLSSTIVEINFPGGDRRSMAVQAPVGYAISIDSEGKPKTLSAIIEEADGNMYTAKQASKGKGTQKK